MKMPTTLLPRLLLTLACALLSAPPIRSAEPIRSADDQAAIDFNRDVRPILAAQCLKCHGPDEATREAGLRLDRHEESTDYGELLRRVRSEDPDERMPPADAAAALGAPQIEILRAWIDAGAPYQKHWSLVPPGTPEVPPGAEAFSAAVASPIDRFIQARLQQVTASEPGPAPQPPADRYTLVRRLYLDLTGLPPTPQQADQFAGDDDPLAYTRLVDRLLASPAFAEQAAQPWLDLARYADTNGYEKDRPRTIWPYRDWVLRAISEDMPFDQFSIEQLAGDMLPDATNAQRIATGFHRNTMLNEEGGIDPLEFRFQAVVDRVATTGTVWMGLTTGCAQCHTHKYDPISHTDYYAMMALLNNADEPERIVHRESVAEQRQHIDRQIAEQEAALIEHWLPDMPASLAALATSVQATSEQATSEQAPENAESREHQADSPAEPRSEVESIHHQFHQWLRDQVGAAVDWQVLRPAAMHSTMPRLQALEDGSILASGDVTKRDVYRIEFPLDQPASALRLEVLPDDSLPAGGPGLAYYEGRRGDFFLSELQLSAAGQRVELGDASHDYGKISVGSGDPAAATVLDGNGSTGWSTSGREGQPSQLVVNLAEPLSAPGPIELELLFERHFAAALGRFRVSIAHSPQKVSATAMPVDLEQALASWARAEQSGEIPRYADLQRQFLRTSPALKTHYAAVEALLAERPEFVRSLVLEQRPADHPRPTFVHHRGEYLQPREQVQPNIPQVFGGLPEDVPADRLSFARWLASEQNPLVGRVVVNRVWRTLFGQGLVRSDGDFGTQSEPPSHPQLLDYLATQWMQNGWSMKWLYRQIVLTATYQQSSQRVGSFDPENRWLSRGPRFRVSAETIRDQFLAASGRLTRQFGGASVYPPQPAAVTELAYGGETWKASEGGDRYRRSLYTFRKRTAPFAAFAVFDAPTGEVCTARRQRSDTPLQALTLLNDEMFLELARHLAQRAAEQGETPEAIATRLFRALLVRPPSDEERLAMTQFLEQQRAADVPPPQAFFLLTRALMNTDEALTKP